MVGYADIPDIFFSEERYSGRDPVPDKTILNYKKFRSQRRKTYENIEFLCDQKFYTDLLHGVGHSDLRYGRSQTYEGL